MTLEVLTGILVVITGFYAYVTFRMLRVNQAAVAAVRGADRELTPALRHGGRDD